MRPPISPSRSCRAAPHDQPSPRRVSPSKRRICRNTASIRPERVLRHSATVGAGHVAHRDVRAARAFEVDRVHANADLLHESQLRRRVEHARVDRSQAVPQHIRIAQQLEQASVFGLRRTPRRRARCRQCGQRLGELRPRRIVVDHLHFGRNFPEPVDVDAFEQSGLSIRIGLAEPAHRARSSASTMNSEPRIPPRVVEQRPGEHDVDRLRVHIGEVRVARRHAQVERVGFVEQ